MIRFIITLPFIIFIFYITFKFIWGEIQYKKDMSTLQEFNDFHKKLIPWTSTISDKKIRQEYLEHCLDLLHGSKKFKFNEEEELMKIRQKFGKYIPELQQESRESQIEKILN